MNFPFFFSRVKSRRYLGILGFLAVVVAIPIVVAVSQNRQDIRQRASETTQATLTVDKTTARPGETVTVSWNIAVTSPTNTPSPTGFGTHCQTLFSRWQAAFGAQRGQTNYNPALDFNNDGTINVSDFSIIRVHTDNDSDRGEGWCQTTNSISNLSATCQTYLAEFQKHFGTRSVSPLYNQLYDLNNDGVINGLDLAIFAGHATDEAWCSEQLNPSSIPAPTVSQAFGCNNGVSDRMFTISWPSGYTPDSVGIYDPANASPTLFTSLYYKSATQLSPTTGQFDGPVGFIAFQNAPGTLQSVFQLNKTYNVFLIKNGNTGPTATLRVASCSTHAPGLLQIFVKQAYAQTNTTPTVNDKILLIQLPPPGTRAQETQIDWKYTSSCTQTPGANPRTSGTCTFTMPQEPSAYEFRLVYGSGFTTIPSGQITINTTTVTSTPTLTCTPRPACLDATPPCDIPQTPDMCPPVVPGAPNPPTLTTITTACQNNKSTVTINWTPPASSTATVDDYRIIRNGQTVKDIGSGNLSYPDGLGDPDFLQDNTAYTYTLKSVGEEPSKPVGVLSNPLSITTGACSGSISGVVFTDTNENGVKDTNERIHNDLTVTLNTCGTPAEDPNCQTLSNPKTVITDGNGAYSFGDLTIGQYYRITHQVPSGYKRTTDDSIALDLRSSRPILVHNFGIVPLPTPQCLLPEGCPTPTSTEIETRLSFDLSLTGIGGAGGNPDPKHVNVPLKVEVFDVNNQLVQTVDTLDTVTYDPQSKTFKGVINMVNLETGKFTIKIKTQKYLKKLVPSIINVTQGAINPVPLTTLAVGDINNDGLINITDYNILVDCGYGAINPKPMTDPTSIFRSTKCQAHPSAANADLNDDGQVDKFDYAYFIKQLSEQGGD